MDNLGGSKQTGAATVAKYHVHKKTKKQRAEMSAIKSEDSWSKFLQALQEQRQCASLHYSTIMMLAGHSSHAHSRQLVYP
jgi:hypothetical protein